MPFDAFYTKNQLLRFMGQGNLGKPESTTRSTKGPGAVDFWGLVQNDSQDFFVKRVAKSATIIPTVILCGPYMLKATGDVATSCIKWVQLLLYHGFKVILWQGESVSPESMITCDSVKMYLDHRGSFEVADSTSVNQHLKRHHCEPSHYFVFDCLVEQILFEKRDFHFKYAYTTPMWYVPADSGFSLETTKNAIGDHYQYEVVEINFANEIDIHKLIRLFPLIRKLSIINHPSILQFDALLQGLACLDEVSVYGYALYLRKFASLTENNITQLNIRNYNSRFPLDLIAFKNLKKLTIEFAADYESTSNRDFFNIQNPPNSLTHCELKWSGPHPVLLEGQSIIPENIASIIEYLYGSNEEAAPDMVAAIKYKCPKLKKIIYYDLVLEDEIDREKFPAFLKFEEYNDEPHYSLIKIERRFSPFICDASALLSNPSTPSISRFITPANIHDIGFDTFLKNIKQLILSMRALHYDEDVEAQFIRYLHKKDLEVLEVNYHDDFVASTALVAALEMQTQLYRLSLRNMYTEKMNLTGFNNLIELSLHSSSQNPTQICLRNLENLTILDYSMSTMCDISQLNAPHLHSININNVLNGDITLASFPYLTNVKIGRSVSREVLFRLKSLPRLSYLELYWGQPSGLEDCPSLKNTKWVGRPEYDSDSDSDSESDSYESEARCSVFNAQTRPWKLKLDNNTSSKKSSTLDGQVSCVILDSNKIPVDTDYIRYRSYEHLDFDEKTFSIRLYQKEFVYDDDARFPIGAEQAETYTCYLSIQWPNNAGSFVCVPTYKEFQLVLGLISPADVIAKFETEQQVWHLFPKSNWVGKEQFLSVKLGKKEFPKTIKLQPIDGNNIDHYLLKYLLEQVNRSFDSELDYLFNGSIDKIDRLNRFMNYFHDFTDGTLHPEPLNDYENLVGRLYGKIGVCRHIAYLFFVIATMLNVKVRYSMSDDHAFVDMAMFYEDDTFMWHSLPVSGYGIRENPETETSKRHRQFFETVTRIHLPKDMAMHSATTVYLKSLGIQCEDTDDQIRKTLESMSLTYTSEMQTVVQGLRKSVYKKDPLFECYSDAFSRLALTATLSELTPLVSAQLQRPVLIIMEKYHNPMVFNLAFSRYYRENQGSLNHYLYIDNPADFKAYFTSRPISSTDLITTPGPLQSVISSPNSLILINWSNFTSAQSSEYTLMLKSNGRAPTLHGQRINPGCRIVGITTNPNTLSETFFQICTVYTLEQSWYTELENDLPTLPTVPKSDLEPVMVNCFQDPSRLLPTLFGDIRCVDGRLQLQNSPLEQAICSGSQLIILNPPKNREWECLWQRNMIENRLYVNGRFINTAALSLFPKEDLDATLPDNLTIKIQSATEMNDPCGFILNSQTTDLLFTTLISNEQNRLTTTSGLLNDVSITTLYLTDYLESAMWLRLKEAIRHCQKPITVNILPGGKLTGTLVNTESIASESFDSVPQTNVIVTKDCHATASRLSREFATVLRIHVHRNSTYADIVSDIGGEIQNGQCLIYQSIGELISQLIKGSTVFLIGELSNELYLQLQSAFCQTPHLWINGQRIYFSGKLYLMTQQASHLAPYPHRCEPQSHHPLPVLSNKRTRDETAEQRMVKLCRTDRRQNVDDDNEIPLSDNSLTHLHAPITVLYGDPGVGKTHNLKTLRNLPTVCIYEGPDQIEAWLTSADDGKEHYLLLDEMNTYPVGTWDFLYGLIDGTYTIFFNRRWATVSAAKKVLGTMNPNHHPGRFSHPIIEKFAERIVMMPPSPQMLIDKVAFPILQNLRLARQLVSIHELARQMSPETGFSIRDLKAFCHRIKMFAADTLVQNAHLQYALPMVNEQQIKSFIQELALHMNAPFQGYAPYSRTLQQVVITETRRPLVQLIRTNMQLRHMDANLKCHILCEGPAASGKSSIILSILEEEFGLVHDDPDPKKCYYYVNAKSDNCKELLLRAAKEGVPIVLAKANYCSCRELLAQLLHGHEGVKPGFIVLASQTPGEKDSDTTSQAIASRCHCIYLKALGESELVECAQKRAIPAPELFVACYSQAHKKSPFTINPHLFFRITRRLEPAENLAGSIITLPGGSQPGSL